MKRLLALVLAIAAGAASAAEAVLPIGTDLPTYGRALIGTQVGYYTLYSNATNPDNPNNPPVSIFVQQSNTFDTLANSRYPASVPPKGTQDISAFMMVSSAPPTKAPGYHYILMSAQVDASVPSYGAAGKLPEAQYADAQNYVYANSGNGPASFLPPVLLSTADEVRAKFIEAATARDAYGKATGWGAMYAPTPDQVRIPALDGEGSRTGPWGTYGNNQSSVKSYPSAPLKDSQGRNYEGILVIYPTTAAATYAQAVYAYRVSDSCDQGWVKNSAGQCESTAGGSIPELWNFARQGYVETGVTNFETARPSGNYRTYAATVHHGLYLYAMRHNGSNPTTMCNNSTSEVDCVNLKYDVLSPDKWTYDANANKVCMVRGYGSPVCVSVEYYDTQEVVCPQGYIKGPAVNGQFTCDISDRTETQNDVGWGCRVNRTNDGRFIMSNLDKDCALAQPTSSTTTGSLELTYGTSTSTFTYAPAQYDANNVMTAPSTTTVVYRYAFARGQVITITLLVSNENNTILNYSMTNTWGEVPRIKGKPGEVAGLEGGLKGGITAQGGTNSPGYGCTTNCPQGIPKPTSPGTIPGQTADPSKPPPGTPGGGDARDPSAPPSAATPGAPDGFKKIIDGATVTTASTCPASMFNINLGTHFGWDLNFGDNGAFCQVMDPFGPLLRGFAIALGIASALYIILSA